MLARTRKLALAATLSALLGALTILAAAPASAQPAGAWWLTDSGASPSILQPGKEGRLWITAIDQGWKPIATASRPVVVEDTLPSGVELAGTAQLFMTSTGGPRSNGVDCEALGPKITCSLTKGTVFASQGVEVVIPVKVQASRRAAKRCRTRSQCPAGPSKAGPKKCPRPSPRNTRSRSAPHRPASGSNATSWCPKTTKAAKRPRPAHTRSSSRPRSTYATHRSWTMS